MKSILIITALTLFACKESYQLRYWDDTTLDKEERTIRNLASKESCLSEIQKLTVEFSARPRIAGHKKTGIKGSCERIVN